MTNDPFITFKQAAELAGKSKKTVERFYNKQKGNADYADAFEHRPDASGAKYFIRESVVLRDIAKGTTGKTTAETSRDGAAQNAIREVVNQLQVKDQQIEAKDRQIENLQQSLQAEQALHIEAAKKKSKGRLLLFGTSNDTEKGTGPSATAVPTTVHTVTVIALSTLATTLVLIQALKLILSFFL